MGELPKRSIVGSNAKKSKRADATAVPGTPTPHQKAAGPRKRGSTPALKKLKEKWRSRRAIAEKVKVSVITTDRGEQAYLFSSRRGRMAVTSKDMLFDKKESLLRIQSALRINLVPKEARRNLEELIEHARKQAGILAVSNPGFDRREGFEDRPAYYAYGDGEIIATKAAPDCVAVYESDERYRVSGEADLALLTISKMVRGQPLPLLVLCWAISPVLLPYARSANFAVENAILELTGRSTTNKSTLATLMAGAVWGGDSQSKLGFAMSWNATGNSIEEMALQHNDGLIILDEATAADKDVRNRGSSVFHVTHRLSLGRIKGRMREGIRNFRLMALSTSNQSLKSILQESAEVANAADVRLINIQCPDRVTGFFENVPEGYPSLENAMTELRQVCAANYGHIARQLIQEVLDWSDRDHDGLIRYIRERMEHFLTHIGLDPKTAGGYDLRRAKAFALAYAAMKIAIRTEVFDKELLGKVKEPLAKAWLVHGRLDVPVIDNPRIREFLAKSDISVIDVVMNGKVAMSDEQLVSTDAFIYKERGGSLLLLMTRDAMNRHLDFNKENLVALREQGILKTNEKGKLMIKACVRRSEGADRLDKFYAFKLRRIPEF